METTLKVFIADDSNEIRDRILNIVESFPHLEVVGTATEVASCIQGVELKQPDLLLLDLRMPGGSGFDVLRELAQTENPPVVVVFTNQSHERYRSACLKLGAKCFVDKSGDIEDLKNAIREAMGDVRAESSAEFKQL